MSPKRWLYLAGGASLAALGALLVPQAVFYPQNEPTAPPKCPQGPKITSKVTPKVQKITPEVQKMTLNVPLKMKFIGDSYNDPNSGPADCAKRFE